MSYLDWHVGMKVVCVDDEATEKYTPYSVRASAGMDGLQRNRVYTIREIGRWRGALVVWLAEIVRPIAAGEEKYGEPGYAAARFRPTLTRKTDISIFKAMLSDTKQKVPA